MGGRVGEVGGRGSLGGRVGWAAAVEGKLGQAARERAGAVGGVSHCVHVFCQVQQAGLTSVEAQCQRCGHW